MSLRRRLLPRRSPGGSRIYDWRGKDAQAKVGVIRQFTAERETAYDRLFETCQRVHHETVPLVPHIDIYDYEPTKERPFHTLVTGGMSDLPMKVPRQVGRQGRRAELVLYASEPKDEYVGLLRGLAHMPHAAGMWFATMDTLQFSEDPEPLFPASELTGLFLLPTPVLDDRRLVDELVIDGDPVSLLWVVPITPAESDYKLAHGAEALLEVFDRNALPVVFDEHRQSLV